MLPTSLLVKLKNVHTRLLTSPYIFLTICHVSQCTVLLNREDGAEAACGVIAAVEVVEAEHTSVRAAVVVATA